MYSIQPNLKGCLATISHEYWEGYLRIRFFHKEPPTHTLTRCRCAMPASQTRFTEFWE